MLCPDHAPDMQLDKEDGVIKGQDWTA